MKRIFYFITILSLTAGLCCYIFNLKDYDFFVQLTKISNLDFPNPIDNFTALSNATSNLTNINELNLEWYQYIVEFFKWVGTLFYVPILFIKDLILDLFSGFQALIYLLGF